MPTHYSRIFAFWKELKRRKVIQVVTVYAASAFVILELTSILAPSLGLPDWTLNLVLLILCVGFVIAVIVSWIYDIHPQAGIVKTEPADKMQPEDPPESSNSWRVASYISFVVILGLIAMNIFSGTKKNVSIAKLDKSIAILPFNDQSPEGKNQYLVNNLMMAIEDNLSKVEELKIIGRVTTEQYRNSDKTPQEIGEELGVSFLIQGWGTLLEDVFLLDYSLIHAQSGVSLATEGIELPYSMNNLIKVKNDIAFQVLDQVQATITEQEAERIVKTSEIDLKGYELYMQAEDYLWEYRVGGKDSALLQQAESLYRKTLVEEPSYARAYLGLAKVYWEKRYWDEIQAPSFMEIFRQYLDSAFFKDDQLYEFYLLKGRYFEQMRDVSAAISQYKLAVSLNPSSWEAYINMGLAYRNFDNIKSLSNMLKAEELYYGPESDSLLAQISLAFAMAGIYDLSDQYLHKMLEFDEDSVRYWALLAINEYWKGNFEMSIELCLKALSQDSLNPRAINRLGYNYLLTREYQMAYPYFKQQEPRSWTQERNIHRFALVYDQVGNKEEARKLFAMHKDRLLEQTELGWAGSVLPYYDLAGIYAYQGEKELALKLLSQVKAYNKPNDWFITLIKNDPLFDSIRDDPVFQEVVLELEAKYQAEHERVREWLEGTDQKLMR